MRLIVLLLMLTCSMSCFAQHKSKKPIAHNEKIILAKDLHISTGSEHADPAEMPSEEPDSSMFFHCFFEPMPVFPGDLSAFISDNLRYPDSAMAHGIEGRVLLRFRIRKDGTVDSASVVRGADKELDSAALELICIMPRWIPGKNPKREPTDVWFVLPITFKLD